VFPLIVGASRRHTEKAVQRQYRDYHPQFALCHGKSSDWSYADAKVRFRIPVSVGYESDVRLVERILLEVTRADTDVLTDPEPTDRLPEFGDSGLHFERCAWTTTLVQRKRKLISDLNFTILDAFRSRKSRFSTLKGTFM
jgi:small-conductance mechanosensitive channel